MKKQDGVLGSLGIWTIFLRGARVHVATPSTFRTSMWSPYLWHLKHLKGTGIYLLFHFFETESNFNFLGYYWFIKCTRYECVSPPLLMVTFYSVTPYILVAKENSLFPLTSFEVLSLLCGKDLFFILLTFFILIKNFRYIFLLSTSKSRFPFLIF